MIKYMLTSMDAMQIYTVREVLSDFLYRQSGQTIEEFERANTIYYRIVDALLSVHDSVILRVDAFLTDEDCSFVSGLFRDRESQKKFQTWWDYQKTLNTMAKLGN